MSTLRKKLITVLAVLFCTLLILSTVSIIPKTKTASAARSDGGWAPTIGEIYSGNGGFNATNMQLLYKALTGNKDATYETVKSTLGGAASKNGYHYLTSANVRNFNDGNNVSVTFGGIKWDVVYITTTRSDVDTDNDNAGDIIVDLWQSADDNLSTSAYADHATPHTGTTGVSFDKQTYPANMYSTSTIRVQTLNAGGYYSISPTALMGEQALTPQTSNFYHRFTVTAEQGEADSLVPYLVQPKNVAYQETENSYYHTTAGGYTKFTTPNEAYGTPEGGLKTSNPSTIFFDYSNKGLSDGKSETNYGAWKEDYLWLVSMSETGNYDGYDTDGTDCRGIWETNVSLRSAPQSKYVWLRTAPGTTTHLGDGQWDTGFHNNYSTTDSTLLVRPAIHFNLTAAKTLYTKNIETTYTGSNITLDTIHTAKPSEAPWYISTVYSTDVGCAYKLNGTVSDVLNVGTYTATMTFNNNDTVSTHGFKWNAKNASSTVDIKVKEKPVKVKFTKGAGGTPFTDNSTVTSGDTTNYPAVDWFDTTQIATTDTGDRKPSLRLKYQSTGDTPAIPAGDEDKEPTIPGTYRATAELVYEDTAQHKNYVLDTESKLYIDFTVKPIEVKAPSLDNTSLTYDGTEHTITIVDHSSDIKYTVYKDSEPIASLTDATAQTFTVKDAGTYTVTFAFDDEKKPYRVWTGKTDNDPYDVELNVNQRELTLTLTGDSEFGSANASWGKGTAKEFTISVANNVAGEDVQLSVYITKSDGSGKQALTLSDGKYTIPDTLAKGDYILYCELTDAPAGTVNDYKKENYVIKYENKERVEKSFKIKNAEANFDETELDWVYTNADVDGGAEKNITSGTHLVYNGKPFTVTLKSGFNDLADMGVKIDGSAQGAQERTNANGVNGAEAEYVITVRFVALDENYNFEGATVEFKWYIDKATYDLSSYTPEWKYRARGVENSFPDDPDNAGKKKYEAQYEGGSAAGENGYVEIFIKSGLPEKLTPVFDTTTNRKNAVGSYTAKITGFTNDDPNYNDITSLPAGVDWLEFGWKIIPRTLPTGGQYWNAAEYSNGVVTKGPTLKTTPYNPNLKYEYFEDADCNGTPLTLEQLEYEEGEAKTYYVKVTVDPSDAGNWKLSSDGDKHGFVIGVTKTAVEIKVTGGGMYDGTPQGVKIEIVGTYDDIDLDSFEITYYNAEGGILTGAPTDVGTYTVEIALKGDLGNSYFIKDNKPYELVIETRILEVPAYEGTLTYNGEERDIAKLAGLPDGWENYLEIRVNGNASNGKIKDVGTYSFIFEIKNASSGNVAWNTTTGKTQNRTLTITVNQLVLHAKKWSKNGYYTAIEFEEEDGDKFVTYTVKKANGEPVTEAEFYAHPDDEYIVEVSVGEEHGENVKIEYAGGVNPQFRFIGSSTDEGDALELENAKNSAKEELEKEAKAKKDAVDADVNLTPEEKKAAKDAIDKELEEGKAEIDKATDLDGVSKALDDGKKEIDDTADLVQKKGAAKSELDKAAQAKKDAIDNDPNLTDEEKAAAKAEVDKELEEGKKAIDGATDVNSVQSAESSTKTNIENIKPEHVGGSFPWWILAVIAGALVLVTVIIIVIVKRRNSDDDDGGYDDFYDDEYDYDEEEEIEDDDGDEAFGF